MRKIWLKLPLEGRQARPTKVRVPSEVPWGMGPLWGKLGQTKLELPLRGRQARPTSFRVGLWGIGPLWGKLGLI